MDNRCPHQGYALLQGEVKEETLTCAWHNWKFELDQGGRASFGGEAVRSYPVEVRNGQVFVSSPPVVSSRQSESDLSTTPPSRRSALARAGHGRRRVGRRMG
ncbi:MAG: Rieske 2Fe-2S domain-containing protein [Acidobacteria bacterium]|nr:Rieske 2Fe-2S domain-containing protein [Acidobacteriota bacterium]MCH8128709.1 Rieske 2Fe-2S domain-containing protein [Acidobacteriota bacterium]MCH8990424.1 Rieske 2Fe-2S domain-containing protein [Acidobacteriota bacterium]